MAQVLEFVPILNRIDLVSPSVAECVKNWRGSTPVEDLRVAQIDPSYAGGIEFCAQYGFAHTEGANCVVVEGQRGSTRTIAAVVIPVGYRTDFNSFVRKHLGVRRVSLAPLDYILSQTGMEYGSITPVGLPSVWRILVDSIVANAPRVVIGSGLKHSKLSIPGSALIELEGAEAIEELAHPIEQ